LNTNGSVQGNLGFVRRGGVLWDSQGNWISGISKHIGFATNNIVELWAVRQGLLIVCELGYKFIDQQNDYEIVICWLTSNGSMALAMVPLICDFRALLSRA